MANGGREAGGWNAVERDIARMRWIARPSPNKMSALLVTSSYLVTFDLKSTRGKWLVSVYHRKVITSLPERETNRIISRLAKVKWALSYYFMRFVFISTESMILLITKVIQGLIPTKTYNNTPRNNNWTLIFVLILHGVGWIVKWYLHIGVFFQGGKWLFFQTVLLPILKTFLIWNLNIYKFTN